MLSRGQKRAKKLKERSKNWQIRENREDAKEELILAGAYRWEWLGKRRK